MPLHPHERHVVRLLGRQQTLPQIVVLHGLLLRVLPAALEPAVNPMLVEGVHHVLRVGVQRDGARALEHFETRHHGHAVVRGALVALRQLLLVDGALRIDEAQHRAVAPRPRIPPRRTVGVYIYMHVEGLSRRRGKTGWVSYHERAVAIEFYASAPDEVHHLLAVVDAHLGVDMGDVGLHGAA